MGIVKGNSESPKDLLPYQLVVRGEDGRSISDSPTWEGA